MSSPPREVIAPSLPRIGATRAFDQSVAVRGGAFVFVSGLTAFDRDTTSRETRQILENLKAILEAAGRRSTGS